MTEAAGQRPYLQIHPTRRCNLRCRHCYTASGPDQATELPVEMLTGAVADAAELGYTELAVSGGEPLLFSGLDELLGSARRAGMVTSITTNAMGMSRRRAAQLRDLVDVVAVSLDGTPESHNVMRGDPRAFSIMLSRLPNLREAGVPLAFITTLTQFNLHELPWLIDFASSQGALMLQVHPLDGQGRAVDGLLPARPDPVELGAALLAAAALAPPNLVVQVDAVMREQIAQHPERFCATGTVGPERLGDWVPSLVVEPDGVVVPVTYGMDRRFAIGSLWAAPLKALVRRWRADTAPGFALAARAAYEAVITGPHDIVFWYEEFTRLIRRSSAVPTL